MNSSLQVPITTKIFRLAGPEVNGEVCTKEDLKGLKEMVQQNAIKIDILMERTQKIAEFLAETNVLLKRSCGLFSSKFDSMFPLKNDEDLRLLEQALQTEDKDDIVSTRSKVKVKDLQFYILQI